MPPCWCLPAAETAFPSDMLSFVSSLFGVMHCDASLSLPRPGSSLCQPPSAPVCPRVLCRCCDSFGLPAAQQPFRPDTAPDILVLDSCHHANTPAR
eukprot:scaffold79349_cov55-Phaeocystis_antarctica.AAC.5